ncbi:MAG: FixH family protein [Phycisphaerae bacterium]
MPPVAEQTNAPAQPGRWWIFPLIVVGLLLFQIGMSLAGVYLAERSPAAMVEADYYNKAMHWDDYEARVRASAALGWQATFTILPPAGGSTGIAALKGERLVEITLTDKLGRPLRGATIAGKYFHHAHPRDGLDIQLKEDPTRPEAGGGIYTAQTPLRRIGTWEFRLLIKRGPDEFILTRQLEVN